MQNLPADEDEITLKDRAEKRIRHEGDIKCLFQEIDLYPES
jgi:hypothetical protein